MGITVTATRRPDGLSAHSVMDGAPLRGVWPGPVVDPGGGPLRFVPAAAAVLRDAGITPPPAHLTITADLPTGRGFSSSAALCLAVCDVLARLAGHCLAPEKLADLAFQTEHDRLGIACGRFDQLACVAGVPVFLPWKDGQAPLIRVVPDRALHLVAAAFSAPRDTPGILAALHRPLPVIGAAFAIFAAGAEAGAEAIRAGDVVTLGAAMNRAQSAYEDLLEPALPELAAPGLRQACVALRERGALGAKFSGAGGDGSVVALFETAEGSASAASFLSESGLAAWSVTVPAGE